MMDYEIVQLGAMDVAGLKARTNNNSSDMGAVIGGLWQQMFETGMFFALPGKVNEKSIGLYTNYVSDESGDYDIYVCCQVDPVAIQASETAVTKIPAGRYARFIVKGDMRTAVQDFWMQLWKMPLKRAFTCDFEEYQPGGTMEDMEIHMYIALTN